jgi:hypothetical protein
VGDKGSDLDTRHLHGLGCGFLQPNTLSEIVERENKIEKRAYPAEEENSEDRGSPIKRYLVKRKKYPAVKNDNFLRFFDRPTANQHALHMP